MIAMEKNGGVYYSIENVIDIKVSVKIKIYK